MQTLCAVPASRDRMRANLRNRYGGQHQLSKIDVPNGPEADRCQKRRNLRSKLDSANADRPNLGRKKRLRGKL
jgi:hypothetical protein